MPIRFSTFHHFGFLLRAEKRSDHNLTHHWGQNCFFLEEGAQQLLNPLGTVSEEMEKLNRLKR